MCTVHRFVIFTRSSDLARGKEREGRVRSLVGGEREAHTKAQNNNTTTTKQQQENINRKTSTTTTTTKTKRKEEERGG